MKCKGCGLVYVNPCPTKEEVQHFYRQRGSDQSGTEGYFNEGYLADSEGHLIKARRVLKEIGNVKKGGTLLDIGCGGGFMVKVAEEAGWDATGIELSDNLVAYAQENLQASVLRADFDDAPFPDEHFDVITMFNVLSHLRNPSDTFTKINSILKKEGLFVFETGNKGALSTKEEGEVLGESWGTPDHLYHFSERTIAAVLEKTGFTAIGIERRDSVDIFLSPEKLAVRGRSGWKFVVKTILLRPRLTRKAIKSILRWRYFHNRIPCLSLTIYATKQGQG